MRVYCGCGHPFGVGVCTAGPRACEYFVDAARDSKTYGQVVDRCPDCGRVLLGQATGTRCARWPLHESAVGEGKGA